MPLFFIYVVNFLFINVTVEISDNICYNRFAKLEVYEVTNQVNTKQVAEYFDTMAESWDSNIVRIQSRIDTILDNAEVTEGKCVLDVACGTGVLIPDYINRNVKKCVAVDISSKMIEIAKSKFSVHKNIEFLCEDAENLEFFDKFDCIVIYNAFPHFINHCHLFKNLSNCLKPNGRITIAHSMSREALIKHHSGGARNVSRILPETEEMAELMKPYFDVDIKISNDEIYIVSGKNINMTKPKK